VGLLRNVSSYSLLFPFCREVAPSATGDLEERCKDPQRVLGRESQPTTHCGCIWSHSQSTSVSGEWELPAANNYCTFYMQSYAILARVF